MVDSALDPVLYRPAVVKAFAWLPRCWSCDLAKLSMALDDRWGTGYWASIIVLGGCGHDDTEEDPGLLLDDRPVHLRGWCRVRQPINSEAAPGHSTGRSAPTAPDGQYGLTTGYLLVAASLELRTRVRL